LFGKSYNKPGRGISKKDAEKRNYFDIFGRHFTHIIGANFWYTLANIVFFVSAILLFKVYFGGEQFFNVVSKIIHGELFIVPILPFVPFVFIGPFTAGYTYVIRNYAKQEPTFLVSDFFEHSKKNLKQGLTISFLSTLVAYLLTQAFVYYKFFFVSNNLPTGVLYTLSAIVLILFVITMFYIYPIMVTFKMNTKVIIKNAWTFTVLKLPQNFLIFIFLAFLNAAVFYILILYFPPTVYLLFLALFMTGFTSFTANYYIWHVLDKYIVSLVKPKADNEAVFNDDEYPELDDEYNEEVVIEDEYLL